MKLNLDRYFELEKKVMNPSISNQELREWKHLNKKIMNEGYIETIIKNDNVGVRRAQTKMKLDAAFEEKFGSSDSNVSIKRNNIIPMYSFVRKVWTPPINWATVASIAAVFAVFFMVQPNSEPQEHSILLADTAISKGVDTAVFSADSLIY